MSRVVVSRDGRTGYVMQIHTTSGTEDTPEAPPTDPSLAVEVIKGLMLNPGDTVEYTLFTQESHRASVVDLTVMVHDLNSNTFNRYHNSKSYWSRSWTNSPVRTNLITPINSGTGEPYHFTVEHYNEGNDIKVRIIHNAGISTNVAYKIIYNRLVTT